MNRLSNHEKLLISTNLVAFMQSEDNLLEESAAFIANWILTVANEKPKAYFDVWDVVLKNYMPTARPILFRSCKRRENGRIASYTGNISCARKFSEGKGFLLICDTMRLILDRQVKGQYDYTFFPISELLKKEAKSVDCKFSESLIDNYSGEDEYVMRTNLNWIHSCKWFPE